MHKNVGISLLIKEKLPIFGLNQTLQKLDSEHTSSADESGLAEKKSSNIH